MLTLVIALPVAAQQPMLLHDGQSLTLQGKLAMEPAGRLQFVTVKTREAYLPMVMGDDHRQHPAEAVHEIGLSGYNRYDLLYRHRGQAVTVLGKLMTDSASPYYFHSTSLQATSIRLADGTELIDMPRAKERVAANVREYRASVVLPGDAAQPWQYRANGTPNGESKLLACSSNGGGDVVNCSCADGFQVKHAESSTKGVGAEVFSGLHIAQFGVGDDARRVELLVTCSR